MLLMLDALDIVDTTPAIVITEILITRDNSTSLQPTTSSSIPVTSHLLSLSTLVLTTCATPSIMPTSE